MDCVGISLLNSSDFQLVSQQSVTATQELWDSDLCILPGGLTWLLWFHVLASISPCRKHHISIGLCYISSVFSWNRVSCVYLNCYNSCRPLKAWSCFLESRFQVPRTLWFFIITVQPLSETTARDLSRGVLCAVLTQTMFSQAVCATEFWASAWGDRKQPHRPGNQDL